MIDEEIETIRVILPTPLVVKITSASQCISSGGGGTANVTFSNPGGRLTTQSGVPVSTTDRTSQGTIYYTPYIHNNVYTYSGSAWQQKTFSEISLSLTLTNGKNYDVFINSAATTLSLSSAWTNNTTRADALGTQDGVTVLGSDHTKLWLGTIRASGSNTTEDSGGGTVTQVGGKRFVWNAYNQVPRRASVIDTAATWSYTSATIRQANGAVGNQVEYVSGVNYSNIKAHLFGYAYTGQNSLSGPAIGIGVDSTITFSGLSGTVYNTSSTNVTFAMSAGYSGEPALGYHVISWNESGGDGTCLFSGNSAIAQSGLTMSLLN